MVCKKIIFRSDAGSDIGYGHFIRSLALADMLKDEFDCQFVTQTPTDYQKKVLSEVCDYRVLPADVRKFEFFLNMLIGDEIVVLDNYFFDTSYQYAIKQKGCHLVCIDDKHDKYYVSDVLINHTLTNPSLFNVAPYTRLCLGLKWALLRRPFLETIKCERNHAHVVVAFGGSDPYDLTFKMARILNQRRDITRITAIVGDAYVGAHLGSLSKVEIVKNLTAQQIADLFRRVGFAVLSSSTIAIEALACGCPIYAGYYVDNQVEFYSLLVRERLVVPLGNLLEKSISIPVNRYVTAPLFHSQGIIQNYKSLFASLCS